MRPHRSQSGPSTGQTLPALDGLRALAIVLVIWHHVTVFGTLAGFQVGPAWLYLLGDLGFSGVFLFFVLSGFLLFLPYARALVGGQPWPSARQFYTRRALRILPAYWGVLALLGATLPGSVLRTHAGSLGLAAVLLQDWQSQTLGFVQQLDTSLWTLAIEWQFYLLLPALALVLAKLAGPRTGRWRSVRLFGGLVGVIACGLFIRALVGLLHYTWGIAAPTSLPGALGLVFSLLYGVKGKYLEVFALGMLTSVLYVKLSTLGTPWRRGRTRLGWLALLLCLAGLGSSFFWAQVAHRIGPLASTDWIFPPDGASWSVLGEWVLGSCFALLLWAVLVGPPFLGRLFSLPPLRFVGKISYSLYLWHWPLLLVLLTRCSSYGQVLIVGSGLFLLVGTISYFVLERPFLRWRRAPAPLKPATVEMKVG